MLTYTFHHTIELAVPAPSAWALVADYRRDPEWRYGVETMAPDPPGPVAAGQRTREVLRFGGRTYVTPGEVVTVAPGRSFRWTADVARGARTVVPIEDARCRVELELTIDVHGAQQLMGPLLARMMRRRLDGDLGRLRTRLCATHTPSSSSRWSACGAEGRDEDGGGGHGSADLDVDRHRHAVGDHVVHGRPAT